MYFVFFLIFFVLAGVVILYATGLKYNRSKNNFERTGVFFIKSYPKDADIYLNDAKQKKRTPTMINRLLPNYYTVRVAKDGYLDWKKNLQISPQNTTFIEDISLFKIDRPSRQLATGKFNQLLSSKNKLYAVINEKSDTGSSLWLFTIANEQLTKYYSTIGLGDFQLIDWSNNSSKVLVEQNENYFVMTVGQANKLQALSEFSSLDFNALFWDSYNDNILYGLANRSLYQIELINKEITLLSDLTVLSAINFKTKILAIVKKDNQYLLQFIDEEKPLLSLPYSANFEFYNPGFDLICLLTKDGNTLFLIEPENQTRPLKNYVKDVNDFRWQDDQFLYWNSSELWAYYPDVGQTILIERISQPIISAFWHPNVVYAFVQTASELKVYELDSRDQRNIYSLINFTGPETNLIFTDKKGDNLYLAGFLDNSYGFYRIKIQ